MNSTNLSSAFVLLLAILIYGVIHSILASLWAKEKSQHLFGIHSQRWYRLVYNLFAILSFLPVLILIRFLPDHNLYTISLPWLVISLLIQGLAALVLIAGLRQTGLSSFLGLQQIFLTPPPPPSIMITSGLYRYVRHPLYTAGLIFIWLVPKMTLNLLVLNIGLTLYILIGAVVEERKLVKEFGEAFQLYKHETPMLIPWKWKRKA